MILISTSESHGAISGTNIKEFAIRSVVSEYCKLDLGGARLSSENIENAKISNLVVWPLEPGWDTVVLVRRCDIVSANIFATKPSVTVKYTLIGSLFGEDITPSKNHEEFVTFFLRRSHGLWRIERPMIAPHVSISAAISELKSFLIDEKDPERIKRINSTINSLKYLSA